MVVWDPVPLKDEVTRSATLTGGDGAAPTAGARAIGPTIKVTRVRTKSRSAHRIITTPNRRRWTRSSTFGAVRSIVIQDLDFADDSAYLITAGSGLCQLANEVTNSRSRVSLFAGRGRTLRHLCVFQLHRKATYIPRDRPRGRSKTNAGCANRLGHRRLRHDTAPWWWWLPN